MYFQSIGKNVLSVCLDVSIVWKFNKMWMCRHWAGLIIWKWIKMIIFYKYKV